MSRGISIKNSPEFVKRVKLYVLIIFMLFIFGTALFSFLSGASFKESFFRTVQTLAFIFDDYSSAYERILEVFLAIVGVFLLWWILWGFSDMVLEGNLKEYLKRRKFLSRLDKMENHIVIIGGGRIGSEISKVLVLKKKNFLIIESDNIVAEELRERGYIVIVGDASDDEVLKRANIDKALKLIITLPNLEKNVMITLGAKELNPQIDVHSRCENPTGISKLKMAGANIVTVPQVVAADKIARDLGF